MSHTYFSHFTVTNGDGAISVRPINTHEAMTKLTVELEEWAKDQYTNSWYWIVPNVHYALVQMQSLIDQGETAHGREVIVPFMSYDGPTGDIEIIQIDAVFITEL